MTTDFGSCAACHSEIAHAGRSPKDKRRCGNCNHILTAEAGDARCDCGICHQGRQRGASLGGVSPISPP